LNAASPTHHPSRTSHRRGGGERADLPAGFVVALNAVALLGLFRARALPPPLTPTRYCMVNPCQSSPVSKRGSWPLSQPSHRNGQTGIPRNVCAFCGSLGGMQYEWESFSVFLVAPDLFSPEFKHSGPNPNPAADLKYFSIRSRDGFLWFPHRRALHIRISNAFQQLSLVMSISCAASLAYFWG